MAIVPYSFLAPLVPVLITALQTQIVRVVAHTLVSNALQGAAASVQGLFGRCLKRSRRADCMMPAPKKIAILPKFSHGMGDLAAVRKIWLHLSKYYDVQIVVPERERSFVQFFPELTDSIVTFDPAKGPNVDADLAISFPDNILSNNFAQSYSAKNVRLLRINEAGYSESAMVDAIVANFRKQNIRTEEDARQFLARAGLQNKENDLMNTLRDADYFTGDAKKQASTTLALGVGENELGVMLDRKIIKYVKKKTYNDPIKRLELLNVLPEELQKAIFNNTLCTEQSVKAFNKDSKLYFTYSEQGRANEVFYRAMTLLEHEANLTFLLIRKQPRFVKKMMKGKLKTDDPEIVRWIAMGFDKVRFIWWNHDQKHEATITITPNSARTLTFISVDSLSSVEFQAALMGSEKECQVRGEQSFFDALILRKIPVYELSVEKNPMINKVVEVASNVSTDVGQIAAKLFQTLPSYLGRDPQARAIVNERYTPQTVDTIASAVSDARLMSVRWERLAKVIQKKHDFFPKLDALVDPCLSE